MKNYLIDIELNKVLDEDENPCWGVTITAGALKLHGQMDESDMLRFVRGERLTLQHCSVFGHSKVDEQKNSYFTITEDGIAMKEAALYVHS